MNEFSRLYRLDSVSGEPRSVEIEAEPAEREALARRFELVGIDSLSAAATLVRRAESVEAAGTLRARVTQSCVATAEPVEAAVEEEFRVEFRPLPADGRPEEEIELGEGELDVVFHEGAEIDLGEAVAQSLLLALDPYPRSPAAEAALREAGVKSEEEARAGASPFAALAALKDKMES
ncbi:MAG TPA: YceD family protein [Allosphingosinicella sp.]|nr:YceD family protein [Allosphingosinicella sp.]